MVITVDERNFSQEVLASSAPVVVNFWAPWCGLCRLVNPLLDTLQAEWGDQVKIVSINADESLKLSNMYRLTNLPTVLLFANGDVLERLDSFHNRDDIAHASAVLRGTIESLYLAYSGVMR
ncbi:thioredoxin family protein [Leptolyngbya sp. AN02str]|uniref:thioredoxin family protein n=1 Tax=Leptolyngbya sp. AN02str TaxID=3423363 RepID=UPI003D323689